MQYTLTEEEYDRLKDEDEARSYNNQMSVCIGLMFGVVIGISFMLFLQWVAS